MACVGFATSISPWVITLEALAPFRCPSKTKQNPPPLPHLKWPSDENATVDIRLEASLARWWPSSDTCLLMADLPSPVGNKKSTVMSTSNLRYLYWTPFQQITHHASAGCGLATGDLLGTGTISGDVRPLCLAYYKSCAHTLRFLRKPIYRATKPSLDACTRQLKVERRT